MLGSGAIARPALFALPSSSRNKWSEQRRRFPKCVRGGISRGFASPRAMAKEASKEPVYSTRKQLVYAVRRRDPELVGPASPLPRETKRLSDLDDLHTMRLHLSMALFYRGRNDGVDPAAVIRRALGEALVHYYPLAGRLREVEGGRLVVDCTGEGVVFVQADADVRLEELEAAGLRPPFPCWEQLLLELDVEGGSGMIGSPLLLIQVTRLQCGGFVFALRFNHAVCDGIGIVQFVNAVSELARGLPSMTVAPVWSRELIQARRPSPTAAMPGTHRDRDREFIVPPLAGPGDMVTRAFSFSAPDIMAMKKSLPPLLRDTATTFDVLAAFLWRARAAALEIPPGEDAPLGFAANFWGAAKMRVPKGYYGNAVVVSTVRVDAGVLRRGSLGDAVALVRRAKAAVTTEYVRSSLDEMVLAGRRMIMPANIFLLSDTTNLGFDRVDFGWGDPVYGGPAHTLGFASFFIAVKDPYAVYVPVDLPRPAMLRFAAEVDIMLLRLRA